MGKSDVKINASAIAQRYADERIIEFSSPNGGGLVAFVERDDQLHIEPYRLDSNVKVNVDPSTLTTVAIGRVLRLVALQAPEADAEVLNRRADMFDPRN